jgi:hypothetical protein
VKSATACNNIILGEDSTVDLNSDIPNNLASKLVITVISSL